MSVHFLLYKWNSCPPLVKGGIVFFLLCALLSALVCWSSKASPSGNTPPPNFKTIRWEYSTDTIRLAVLGDIGHDKGKGKIRTLANTLYALHQERPLNGGVLLLGDNFAIEKDNTDKLLSIAKVQFEGPFKSLVEEGVSFYAILGNHDNDYGLEPFELSYPLFHLQGNYYYTKVFGKGLVEVFFLYSRYLRENPQNHLLWLDEKLRQSSALWKIALIHHPIYTTALGHRSSKTLAKSLEPLFKEYGVFMVFQGHNHVYEHLEPIQGVHYFTVGSSGKVQKGDLSSKGFKRLGGNDRTTAFLILDFEKDKCLFTTYDSKGVILDQGIIPGIK